MKRLISLLLCTLMIMSFGTLALAEEQKTPVHDSKGFCVTSTEFMKLYDDALKGIDYHDWVMNLKKDDEGKIVPDPEPSEKLIPIGYVIEGKDRWTKDSLVNCYLSFTGNDDLESTMKEVSVIVDDAQFLLTNYSDYRSALLGYYAALIWAIEPDIETFDDAMVISDAAFEKASGGAYIHHVRTRELPNLPAVYNNNGVNYTIDIDVLGQLVMTATIG